MLKCVNMTDGRVGSYIIQVKKAGFQTWVLPHELQSLSRTRQTLICYPQCQQFCKSSAHFCLASLKVNWYTNFNLIALQYITDFFYFSPNIAQALCTGQKKKFYNDHWLQNQRIQGWCSYSLSCLWWVNNKLKYCY